MNFYGILPLVAIFANAYICAYIFRKNPKEKLNRFFSLFALSLVIWSIGDLGVFSAKNMEVAILGSRIAGVGASLTSVFLLHFCIVFTNSWRFRKKGYLFLLYVPTILFIALNVLTSLVTKSVEPTYWGFYAVKGALYFVFTLYVSTYSIFGLYLCYKYFLKADKYEEKYQSKLLIIGLSIPIVGGIVTQIFLPLLGIKIIPLVTTLTSITALVIAYAIIKYRFMESISWSPKTIRTKIFTIIFVTGFVLVTSMVTIFYTRTTKTLQNSAADHLSTTVSTRASWIDTFFLERRGDVFFLSQSDEIVSAMLTQKPDTKIYNRLRQAYGYENLILINSSGQIFWTAKEGVSNSNNSNLNLYTREEEGLGKLYHTILDKKNIVISDMHISRATSSPVIYIGAPVQEKGRMTGVVVVEISIDEINRIMLNREGLGDTGETYLVGMDKLMRSDSRFLKESSVMKQEINTKNLRDCIEDFEKYSSDFNVEEHNEGVGVYRGYLEEEVMGTHGYVPSVKWCVMAEISKEEAMGPASNLIYMVIMVCISILGIVYIISKIGSRFISRPLIALREGAEIIEMGDFDHKVGTKSQDEIGQLSRAFDKMTAAIKRSRAEVDQKVDDQTQDIKEQKSALENQQEELLNVMAEVERKSEDIQIKNTKLGDQRKAILNILEDVDDEREDAIVEKRKLDTILHSIGDGVFVIDNNRKIVMFNQVAADLSGYTINEAIGKQYEDVLKFTFEDGGKKNDKFINNVLKNGGVSEMAKYTLLTQKNRNKIVVADSAAALKDENENVIGCIIVFRDISEEREIDRMKNEFISLASHQLRTPLSAMKWFAEMLSNGDVGNLTDEQLELVNNIYESNERMIDLVNSLLNISRIESGRIIIDPELTDLKELVKNVIDELKVKWKEKNQRIIFSGHQELKKVSIDPKLIRNAYMNLISNAIKYTPEKGEVTILLSRDGDNVVSQISDNGYGIPKKDHAKIFTKFYRASNTAKLETDGSGLGLYLVKTIVESSGGKIWFKSVENKGTAFWFTLPLKGTPAKEGEVTIDT